MRWVDVNSFDSFSEMFWSSEWLPKGIKAIFYTILIALALSVIISQVREKE